MTISTVKRCATCKVILDYRNANGLCRVHFREQMSKDAHLSRLEKERIFSQVCDAIRGGASLEQVRKQFNVTRKVADDAQILVSSAKPPRQTVSAIIATASRMSMTTPEELCGTARNLWLVKIRHAVYLAAFRAGRGYSEIGRVMNRDHTTIMHGVQVSQERARRDPVYNRYIEDLCNATALVDVLPPKVEAGYTGKPRNDFSCTDETADGSHKSDRAMRLSSRSFASALNAAMAA